MKKGIAIILSLLLLLSSSGIAYSQHFCSGYEVMAKFTLGEMFLSCGMEMSSDSCDSSTETQSEKHCCDNEYTSVETDDTFSKTSFEVAFTSPAFITPDAVFAFQQAGIDADNVDFFADYSPPPLGKDIPVLYQIFLI
ncbi:MAG: hypothetical protein OQJ83_13490 [Altibacter sp.]|nr:hypothetical protein [Altibacter sp.]